ncbi:hypothetical protein BYT27DRAFT_7250321 [Phlegmacium glaucopus]|nr:hypothetical protein BYT27DRAFT_7250321 [Phlegmacium glaucopus]
MNNSNADHASGFSWLSLQGKNIICEIIQRRLPQWSNGPRDSQVDCWAHNLERIPTILITSTGWGKTAAFFGAVMVLQHLNHTRPQGIPKPPPKPVALVVTPLIELGNAHAREMVELGLKAILLNAESLQVANTEGQNLFSEIQESQWAVVLLSAERLASTEIDKILRDQTFRQNLVLLGIDESHLLVPWGKDFRQAYHQISLLRKRLPPHTAIVMATATLSAGRDFTSLCKELDLKHGQYHCICLSSEHPNVHMVIRELTHTLGGYQFPDIVWAFKHGVKAVIYCRTLDLCFRVALYGWRQCPTGVARLDKIWLWTSITSPSYNTCTLKLFKTCDETTTIIASIAFGMGMNQNGRAGRDLEQAAQAWTYVESSILNAVRASAPTPQLQKHLEGLDADLVKLLKCYTQRRCLIACVNVCLSNPGPTSNLHCLEAGRPYPCSSCVDFDTHHILVTTTTATTTTAPPKDHTPTAALPPLLTKSHRRNTLQWLNHFAITRWAQKTDVAARHLPHDVLWIGTSLDFILDHFHLLRSRQSLDTILPTWKYLQSDGDALFTLIEDLNHRFDHYIQQMKKNRTQKAALTSGKRKKFGSIH